MKRIPKPTASRLALDCKSLGRLICTSSEGDRLLVATVNPPGKRRIWDPLKLWFAVAVAQNLVNKRPEFQSWAGMDRGAINALRAHLDWSLEDGVIESTWQQWRSGTKRLITIDPNVEWEETRASKEVFGWKQDHLFLGTRREVSPGQFRYDPIEVRNTPAHFDTLEEWVTRCLVSTWLTPGYLVPLKEVLNPNRPEEQDISPPYGPTAKHFKEGRVVSRPEDTQKIEEHLATEHACYVSGPWASGKTVLARTVGFRALPHSDVYASDLEWFKGDISALVDEITSRQGIFILENIADPQLGHQLCARLRPHVNPARKVLLTQRLLEDDCVPQWATQLPCVALSPDAIRDRWTTVVENPADRLRRLEQVSGNREIPRALVALACVCRSSYTYFPVELTERFLVGHLSLSLDALRELVLRKEVVQRCSGSETLYSLAQESLGREYWQAGQAWWNSDWGKPDRDLMLLCYMNTIPCNGIAAALSLSFRRRNLFKDGILRTPIPALIRAAECTFQITCLCHEYWGNKSLRKLCIREAAIRKDLGFLVALMEKDAESVMPDVEEIGVALIASEWVGQASAHSISVFIARLLENKALALRFVEALDLDKLAVSLLAAQNSHYTPQLLCGLCKCSPGKARLLCEKLTSAPGEPPLWLHASFLLTWLDILIVNWPDLAHRFLISDN